VSKDENELIDKKTHSIMFKKQKQKQKQFFVLTGCQSMRRISMG